MIGTTNEPDQVATNAAIVTVETNDVPPAAMIMEITAGEEVVLMTVPTPAASDPPNVIAVNPAGNGIVNTAEVEPAVT